MRDVYIEWRTARGAHQHGPLHMGELYRDGAPLRRPVDHSPLEPPTYIVANRNRALAEADVAIIMKQAREEGAL